MFAWRRQWRADAWAVLLLMLLTAAGCSSGKYLRERREPFNPLAGPLRLLSREGPSASERTLQILRRYDLEDEHRRSPGPVLVRLQEELAAEPTADKCYALAELAYLGGVRAQSRRETQQALDYFAVSVAHTYLYLFDPRYDGARNHYDPMFRQACDLYNVSLESALRIYRDLGRLRPGRCEPIQIGERTIDVNIVLRGAWPANDIERLEFVSDYELEGLSNRHHNFGLGVPLIAVRRSAAAGDPAEAYYPPGLSFAVTAFLRVLPRSAEQYTQCTLELHDPLVSRHTQVGPLVVPLETDLTTPLAYFLDTPEFDQKANIATLGLLNPHGTQRVAGIFMVEPYNPTKIPVLMVHGLWSTPVTWMEMFNDLRSFPEIRENYQFWFYLYPTGQPFWVSAAQLRDDLARMQQALRPYGQPDSLNYTVLVGHSMGGLVSRLQTIDSRDDFWRIVSDQPFDNLRASDEERQELARLLFFQPNESVRRVITVATPHRGSRVANDYVRWLGRQFIRLPQMLVSTNERLIRGNPGLFRNTDLLTITTSLDSLADDSPILPVIIEAHKAPWVRYHNIVGVVSQDQFVGRLAAESDGVVAFASARLSDAESEIVVNADHVNVHQHPRSILEVRRILLDNLRDYEREIGRKFFLPAGQSTAPSGEPPNWGAPPDSAAPSSGAAGGDEVAPLPPDLSAHRQAPPGPRQYPVIQVLHQEAWPE
jgi:pimeloyl-ACP methyl ester carboxylesterase